MEHFPVVSVSALTWRTHAGFNVNSVVAIAPRTSPPNGKAKDSGSLSGTGTAHHVPVFNRRRSAVTLLEHGALDEYEGPNKPCTNPREPKKEPFPSHDLDSQINLLLGLGHSVSPLQFATTSLTGRRPFQLASILNQFATNTSTESLDSLREFQFKTVLVSTLLEVRVHTIALELQEEIDWADGCIAWLASSLVGSQDRLGDWVDRHMCVHSLQGGLQGGLPGWKQFAGWARHMQQPRQAPRDASGAKQAQCNC